VLAAASTVMIRTKLDRDDVAEAEPLRLTHISFGADDRIEIGGLRVGAVLILDGNPLRRLAPSDTVTLQLRPEAIRILRPGASAPAAQ
jgi:hypothetical protein